MKTIYGKQIYDTMAEAADPKHTALLIVDMQNDFVHNEGHRATLGKDVTPIAGIVDNIQRLVEAARETRVNVIWIMNTRLSGGVSDSPAWIALKSQGVESALEYTIDGTWGQQFVEPLVPLSGEPIVKKFRSSAFVNTELDLILRSQGVQTVVVVGCATQGCIYATDRSAQFYDYYSYVVGDCVASTSQKLHKAALDLIGSRRPVLMAEDYLRLWRDGASIEERNAS